MKNLKAFFLLGFASAAIVASLIAIWQNQYFMSGHLIGSFILLSFVLVTMDFRNTGTVNQPWGIIQKSFFVLGWIYISFLILNFIALSILSFYQYKNGSVQMKSTLIIGIVVGVYAFLAVDYFRKQSKVKGRKSKV